MSGLKLVQYVIVRRDLIDSLKWPVGAVIAQACHACTAVVHMTYDDEHTQLYLSKLDNMHKVVLEAPNDDTLRELARTLTENKVQHKLWIEQPENIATCIAVKPSPKEAVHKFLDSSSSKRVMRLKNKALPKDIGSKNFETWQSFHSLAIELRDPNI